MPNQPAPSTAGPSAEPSRAFTRAQAARRRLSEAEASRKQLPPRAAYALAAGVIGLGLFASVTPSPLYHSYSVLWHFSSLTLTLIFATYSFGVLTTLLLAGRVSDQVGRRPVLLAALVAVIPHQHRAAVMSAFYVVAYASLSLPAVLAGLVVTHLGLQVTFETFGSIVAVVALAMAIEAWRTRPR